MVYELEIQTAGETGAGRATRRLRVPDFLTLDDLHQCIQLAFGWDRRPLRRYVFEWGPRRFLPLDADVDLAAEHVGDSEFTQLGSLGLHEGSVLRYVYDFANFHVHHIVVTQIDPDPRKDSRPRCLSGQGVAVAGGESTFDPDIVNRALAETFASLGAEEC